MTTLLEFLKISTQAEVGTIRKRNITLIAKIITITKLEEYAFSFDSELSKFRAFDI
jgi:hypothetical protein